MIALVLAAATATAATTTTVPAQPASHPKRASLHAGRPHRALIVSGRARFYNFARSYQTGTNDTSATSLAIKLHVETPVHNGFGLGATYYSANPIADGEIIPSQTETSLPAVKVNTLAEAYAQYSSDKALVRAGRQTLNTPWANAADSRVIPISYEGIGGAQAISLEWSIAAYRIFRAKNRTVATFSDGSFVSAAPTDGFAVVGATRKTQAGTLALWDYHFNRISSLQYAELNRTVASGAAWHTGFAAQYGAESGAIDGILSHVESHVYGARVLAGTRNLEFALAYDRIPFAVGGYNNGAFVSPYGYSDNADPIFTTLIGDSLVDKATEGQSYAFSTTLTSDDKRSKVILARGREDLPTTVAIPKNELYETDADAAHDFFQLDCANPLNGLWLHERFFVQDTTVKPYRYEQSRFFVDYVW